MLGAAILWVSLGAVGAGDYLRPFGSKVFDQATLDAEGFGDKKALAREDDGLRVTLAPGGAEAGWKTPQALRLGGDCTITATLVIRKLPKPAGEDGAAIGLAVATQNIDAPDATLLRQVETDGKDVYRPSTSGGRRSAAGDDEPQQMVIRSAADPTKPAKAAPAHRAGQGDGHPPGDPPRGLDPALPGLRRGRRAAREIGHFEIGPGDLAGVKLFVANRSGAEPSTSCSAT